MTALPNAHIAEVPENKILRLLNTAHPDGAGKAAFFLALGCQRTHCRVFQRDLAGVAKTGAMQAVVTTEHGTKYGTDGSLAVPRGGTLTVRTIWILDQGAEVPRLVTAYPAEVGEMNEHDRVVLLKDLPHAGLAAGDVGTIVHVYADHAAFEVEFVSLDGHTRAVETVTIDDVRGVSARDMTHAHEIHAASCWISSGSAR
jgi:hypothetical protein